MDKSSRRRIDKSDVSSRSKRVDVEHVIRRDVGSGVYLSGDWRRRSGSDKD